MKPLAILGGRVVDPSQKLDARRHLLLSEGRVAGWLDSPRSAPADAQILDAEGCIVAPGFIDLHAHLREPGFEYQEDIESGARAAAAGGFTTLCCMPNTNPVNDTSAVTEYLLERARAVGVVRVAPIGAISRCQEGRELADIGDMARAGAVAISDDGRPVMDGSLMRRAMEYAGAFGLFVISHPEDKTLSQSGVMHEGAVSTALGLKGIPSAAEEAMIARDLLLARLTGSRLHLAHLSSKGSVELVRRAKAEGLPVTAEVTPHHLSLTDESVADYDPALKVNPPLRTEADREALLRGLADGTIDAVATDHAPHDITAKEVGFQEAAFGMVGLETALPLILRFVHEQRITMRRLVEILSSAPARIMGFEGRGTLAPGALADLTIFDPGVGWTIHAEEFRSKSRNTPFDGLRVRGRVKWTIVGGRVVYTRALAR